MFACELAAGGECRRVGGSRFPLLGAAEFTNILIDGACREVVVAQVARHRELAHQGLSRRHDFAHERGTVVSAQFRGRHQLIEGQVQGPQNGKIRVGVEPWQLKFEDVQPVAA